MSESIEQVKKQLGEYADLLTFEVVGGNIRIQLKAFLHGEEGKAKWEAMNERIKSLGGTWVGGIGKNSHWRIPFMQESRMDKEQLVKDALAYAKHCVENLEKAGY